MISYCATWGEGLDEGLFETTDAREVVRVRDEKKAEGYEVRIGISID